MVGHVGSPTCIVYVDVTLTRSKVKASKFPKIVILIAGRPQEAVHASNNDHQPPFVLFYLLL